MGVDVDVSAEDRLLDPLCAAVGRLAPGLAHELNTPAQFVGDSVRFAREGAEALARRLADHRDLCRALAGGGVEAAALAARLRALAADDEAADVDYLAAHLPGALDRALEGVERISALVASLKEVARGDGNDARAHDVQRLVEATLAVSRNEWKYVAELATAFEPLPPLRCRAADVCRFVLDSVLRAARAIGDAARDSSGARGMGRITVGTRVEGDAALLSIAAGDGAAHVLRLPIEAAEPARRAP
jgi:hypothetical protein